ncbi:MAG: rhodanese-like domain-containing protein [Limnohabitans sp.]|nr:rhodanese-like domain-containing protein [Limnohabitans sp.]
MRNLLPRHAWEFLQTHKEALLIDVRMEIESMYVGRPPGSINIPWYEYPEFTPDVHAFTSAVMAEANNLSRALVLICCSGQRTIDTALALEEAGFTQVINVVHGFEGDLNDQHQRSSINGWRFDGLPWEQL